MIETGESNRALQEPLDEAALRIILERHRTWLESGGKEGARARLVNGCLTGRSLWRVDLRRAELDGADLRRANLDHARLAGASLERARLEGASLWEADLAGCDLRKANLRDANLDHAVLEDADLREADLTGASLWGARLERADLRGTAGPSSVARPETAALVPPPASRQEIRIGAVYADARRPRHRWRVTELLGQLCRVERVDNPNVVRFPAAKVLQDATRYTAEC
ncbi:pentapeptide repeat-containing protein [Benzoatithermus flavus]|uniref:Pentapeptide repeat-containing protein n=1 Tax=Benzoatithermus flavus TaxID=3108223 RepID=A0ABU8XP82_9PROT